MGPTFLKLLLAPELWPPMRAQATQPVPTGHWDQRRYQYDTGLDNFRKRQGLFTFSLIQQSHTHTHRHTLHFGEWLSYLVQNKRIVEVLSSRYCSSLAELGAGRGSGVMRNPNTQSLPNELSLMRRVRQRTWGKSETNKKSRDWKIWSEGNIQKLNHCRYVGFPKCSVLCKFRSWPIKPSHQATSFDHVPEPSIIRLYNWRFFLEINNQCGFTVTSFWVVTKVSSRQFRSTF